MAFDVDPRWLGDAAWQGDAPLVDASSGAEPPYDLHAPPADPPIDPAAFKEALAGLASGVAIIWCWDGARRAACWSARSPACRSIRRASCSAVRKEASSHDVLVRSERCGVAILAEHDETEALRFSTSSLTHERFDPEAWGLADDAPPTYRGGLSTTACVIDQRIDTGTHTVFIATAASVRLAPGQPLVAHARSFQRLAP